MTLHIGENIRALRKTADMTQEQLADRLGVSCQSVSRWENGGTYPDLELIPAIAGVFSVSVDALLGVPEMVMEEKAARAQDALRREALKPDFDPAVICESIRDIRRNYIGSGSMWRFWVMGNNRCYCHPDILPEVRLTAEVFLERCRDTWERNQAIETMACVEDEEHIEAFLERYASAVDITVNTLKMKRYYSRGQWDKYDLVRQDCLFLLMDSLCDSRNYVCSSAPFGPPCSPELNAFQLDTLNRFCGYAPDSDHPVSGSGKADFWIEIRLMLGFRQACGLAAEGRGEEAFTVLEDCAGLLEQIMAVTEPTVLTCSSPWLQDKTFTAEPGWYNYRNDPDGDEEYSIEIRSSDGSTYMIYPSVYCGWLTGAPGWDGFDGIRGEKRFGQITEKIRSLIRRRPGGKNGK